MPQWEILLRARAVENQAFVVAVNRVGQGALDDFSGHSLVIDPLGNVILQAPDNQEGVFSVDIDLSEVEKFVGIFLFLLTENQSCIIKGELGCFHNQIFYKHYQNNFCKSCR